MPLSNSFRTSARASSCAPAPLHRRLVGPTLLVLGLAGALGSIGAAHAEDALPRHRLPVSPAGNLVVGLCDGETALEVPGVKPGETLSRAQAQAIADTLMGEWRRKHPDAPWVGNAPDRAGAPAGEAMPGAEAPAEMVLAQNAPRQPAASGTAPARTGAPASGGAAPGGAAPQVQTYGAFTERDHKIWKASTDALVAEGKRIFHDAQALGGTDGISCDMCHPDAANTHPETYPKYQVQLGRVALLRDMLNWCIENPVRGKPFADDDPRLKALEAYILAQRKGVALDYGKH